LFGCFAAAARRDLVVGAAPVDEVNGWDRGDPTKLDGHVKLIDRTGKSAYDVATLHYVKRRTVSLTQDAVDALERLARQHDTNVSCVVEAAAKVIAEGGPGAQAVERQIVPDRRGGRRVGAGRPKREAG
jgi:hypothetical protein